MKRRKVLGAELLALVLAIALLTAAFPCGAVSVAAQEAKTWYVDNDLVDYTHADFTSIQDAVDAASAGDTITVYLGTYTENVDVNKSLTIESVSGAEVTIVQAASLDDVVFNVTADYVTISGFTVKGQGGMMGPYPGKQTGIWLDGVEQCVIRDNILTSISDPTNLAGICLSGACNNTLSNNTALNCHFAIDLFWGSHNNSLIDNTTLDSVCGIRLFNDCSNNTLTGNTMLNNRWNFWASGEPNNVDTSNTVNSRPIQYLVDKDGLVIDSSWNVGYLGLIDCTNITVKDLTLINNGQGLLIAHSSGISVEGIDVSNNFHGIDLRNSSGNTLMNSIISYNGAGIYIRDSSYNKLASNSISNNSEGLLFISSSNNVLTNNTFDSNHRIGRFLSWDGGSNNNHIYLNNFINNLGGIESVDSTNIWHSPAEIAYTYNGNTYTSYLGNYWDDYTGSDADGDGIGDTPYGIDSDNDNYPLMQPFENYEIGPVDTTPPTAVIDLAVSEVTTDSITLTWTAPGDDTDTGTASEYDIRYSTSEITETNWDSATQCLGEPAPQPAGSTETFTVICLSPGTKYYFALKTADEVGNWSDLSNIVGTRTVPSVKPMGIFKVTYYYCVYNSELDGMQTVTKELLHQASGNKKPFQLKASFWFGGYGIAMQGTGRTEAGGDYVKYMSGGGEFVTITTPRLGYRHMDEQIRSDYAELGVTDFMGFGNLALSNPKTAEYKWVDSVIGKRGCQLEPWHSIAVDPGIISLSSSGWIQLLRGKKTPWGTTMLFSADDVGGKVKGKHIDIYVGEGEAAKPYWSEAQAVIFLGTGSRR